MTRARRFALTLAAALAVSVSLGASSAAAAGPVLDLHLHRAPTEFAAGETGKYAVELFNVGDAPTSGPIEVTIDLPPGILTAPGPLIPSFFQPAAGSGWSCPAAGSPGGDPGGSQVTCTYEASIKPLEVSGSFDPLTFWVAIDPAASGVLTTTAVVSGGGSPPAGAVDPTPIGDATGLPFGLAAGSLLADAFDTDGVPARQAGSHPFRATASFVLNRIQYDSTSFFAADSKGHEVEPSERLRTIEIKLPRGVAGNPRAVGLCPPKKIIQGTGPASTATACPSNSQVGLIHVEVLGFSGVQVMAPLAVYNVEPARGQLARLAFALLGVPITIGVELDPVDYSIVTKTEHINETLALHRQTLNLWGVPADPAYDHLRADPERNVNGASSDLPERPFLSLPTQCGVRDDTVALRVNSWRDAEVNAGSQSTAAAEVSGCNRLGFAPQVQVRPTTNLADTPSGLEFDLHIPQNEDPDGLATAHLRDVVVELPEGMTVNAPSADGLGSCSLDQFGMTADGTPTATEVPNGGRVATPVRCPDASKIGTAEALAPAIDHPLHGAVYLAEQNANPFGSLLALYLVVEDPQTGIRIKLPGKVEADPVTGQLTTTFRNNPQLPVEDIRLSLKQGPRAPLKTPAACGVHTTSATLTPWSSPEGADVVKASSFELVRGPGGSACLPTGGSAPNNPSFSAGTADPTAKAFTPFTLKLARSDGTQQLRSIDTVLPKGLVGRLAGTPYCSDAALASAAGKSGKSEQGSPSCPGASQVGTVDVGAGAGTTPLYVEGKAYLAGPYKGAPLSMAFVTPAVAGPFDLGTVVVRAALHVDPDTAQVRAVSDEIPQILQGIPLNIRSIALKADKPNFILNPTSCDPMKVEGSATSVFNQSASLSNPFQVGECNKLGFKPNLAISLKGGTKRSQFPALTALLTARPGDANIGRTVVALPPSAFLAQSHIRTICTRVQFAVDACPPGSVYGEATAWSPLLDQPLSGNVYLRSSLNPLPDMVVALEGQIDVNLVGRIDSFKRGIRTTFDTVPDAPVSKFLLRMQGGQKGLLENSRNLCTTVNKATVEMTGQNGASYEARPVVKAKCPKQKKAMKKARPRPAKPSRKG